MHRVTLWLTVQRMKIEPLHIHVFGPDRTVQRIKPDDATLVHCFLDPRRRALFKQVLQTFMKEAPDHVPSVINRATVSSD